MDELPLDKVGCMVDIGCDRRGDRAGDVSDERTT